MTEDQFWIGVHGVVVHEGKLLVLRRAPGMSYQPGSWDLPGGHLALGELAEECLAREIEEETGLTIEMERLLCVHNSVGPYVQIIYACSAKHAGRELRLRPWEHVEWRWVTPEELGRLELIPYLAGIIRRGMLEFIARKR